MLNLYKTESIGVQTKQYHTIHFEMKDITDKMVKYVSVKRVTYLTNSGYERNKNKKKKEQKIHFMTNNFGGVVVENIFMW